jgi:hypothetical protein
MNDRARTLHATADQQLAELIDLAAALDVTTARRPCPGREKLGDGTVAALAQHTADNYQRIAEFVTTSDHMIGHDSPGRHGGHRIPRLLRALGHGPSHDGEHGPGTGLRSDRYTAETADRHRSATQVESSRDALEGIAELTDSQLDTIPPKDSFRFCDGQRTLQHVLTSLFKHQRHQLDALKQALA